MVVGSGLRVDVAVSYDTGPLPHLYLPTKAWRPPCKEILPDTLLCDVFF